MRRKRCEELKAQNSFSAFFSSIAVVMIVISLTVSSAHIGEDILAWKVEVGDTITYTIKKFYEIGDPDGNGDPNSRVVSAFWEPICNEEGEGVNVTLQEGTTMKVNLTHLDNNRVNMTVIWNNEDFSYFSAEYGDLEHRFLDWAHPSNYPLQLVVKTLDNQTYWEAYAQEETYNENNSAVVPPSVAPYIIYSQEVSLEGDLLVTTVKQKPDTNYALETFGKRNWKTGWVTYYSEKSYNLTDPREWTMDTLHYEWTMTTPITITTTPTTTTPEVTTTASSSSFPSIPLILSIFGICVFYLQKIKH